MKKRRKRKYVDWPKEIAKGNTDAFYKSTDWDIAREAALNRDKHKCQFFLGNWHDGIHKPYKIDIVEANTVRHKIPIKERPDLCLDLDNLVSLSFDGHEIIEDRYIGQYIKSKPKDIITEERW